MSHLHYTPSPNLATVHVYCVFAECMYNVYTCMHSACVDSFMFPCFRLVRRAIGTFGTGPGQFNMPIGVVSGPRDELFVADRQNHRVQKLSSEGKFLFGYGGYGNRLGSLSHPEAVAVAGERLFVADTGNHRIQVRGQHCMTVLFANVSHMYLCSSSM